MVFKSCDSVTCMSLPSRPALNPHYIQNNRVFPPSWMKKRYAKIEFRVLPPLVHHARATDFSPCRNRRIGCHKTKTRLWFKNCQCLATRTFAKITPWQDQTRSPQHSFGRHRHSRTGDFPVARATFQPPLPASPHEAGNFSKPYLQWHRPGNVR